MSKRIFYSLAFLLLIAAGASLAQQPANAELELQDLLRRARIGTTDFKNKFKDLTAEEVQIVEEFDAKGTLEKQRRIEADLFIYQSQLDPSEMVEYRDVKSVDGKPVKKREARLVNLLNKSAKAGSVKKELERINRESSRYDLGFKFYGNTLYQGLPLTLDAKDAVKFTLVGREQINGHDVIVVEYQQVSQTPAFNFELSLPTPLKGSVARNRGRFWFDAETAQIRREVREVTLQPPSLDHPLVFIRHEFEYEDSRFGFLTPKRIAIINYTRGHLVNNKPVFLLGGKVTFEYGAFTRFDVATPDATITSPPKP